MLVEDSTNNLLPSVLQEMILSMKQSDFIMNDLDQHDLLVCVLCTLMKECDLQPLSMCKIPDTNSDDVKNSLIPLHSLHRIWKNKETGHYNISFVLGHFMKYRFRFVGIPTNALLIVNVIICGLPKHCYSMSICCNDYISNNNQSWDCIASIFTNLKDLSLKFKNSIGHPVRSVVLNEEGIPNASFLGIPHEIQLKILGYLKMHDLAQVAQMNKYLCYLSKDQRLWKALAHTVLSCNDIKKLQKKATEIKNTGEEKVDWKQECRNELRTKNRIRSYYLLNTKYYFHNRDIL